MNRKSKTGAPEPAEVTTSNLQKMILKAFEQVGGIEYLKRQAENRPEAAALLRRILGGGGMK